jgi:hypothetical protein
VPTPWRQAEGKTRFLPRPGVKAGEPAVRCEILVNYRFGIETHLGLRYARDDEGSQTDRGSAAVLGTLMDLAKIYENSKDPKDYPAGTTIFAQGSRETRCTSFWRGS